MGSLDSAIDQALTSGGDTRDPGAGAGGGAGGGRGAAGGGGLMGALSKGGNWWSHKISHQGADGGEELAGSRDARRGSLSAAKRWVGMYGKGSDLLAAANGEQEADRLADKRAKKALRSGCHGLDCLFSAAAKAESHDGLATGGALSSAMKQLHLGGGSSGGITAADFGKGKTATHTGMHYGYRLGHLSMTHGGSGIPKTHSENGVNVPGQVAPCGVCMLV